MGKHKKLHIESLMQTANKIGNVFLDKGLKKGDVAFNHYSSFNRSL